MSTVASHLRASSTAVCATVESTGRGLGDMGDAHDDGGGTGVDDILRGLGDMGVI